MKNKEYYTISSLQINFTDELNSNKTTKKGVKVVEPTTNTVLLEMQSCVNPLYEFCSWLEQEKKLVLSETERAILSNYKGLERWLFRNSNGVLYLSDTPDLDTIKGDISGTPVTQGSTTPPKETKTVTAKTAEKKHIVEFPFGNLFSFLLAGQDPVNIDELLKR